PPGRGAGGEGSHPRSLSSWERGEGFAMQWQQRLAIAAFEKLRRCGVARVYLDGPGHAILHDRIDAEQAAQREPGQHRPEVMPSCRRLRIERQRADVSTVLIAGRV